MVALIEHRGTMDVDLVLDGGGVRGIGLVGAISVLDEEGYRPQRVAGTSAGAIVGALVAAGMPVADLEAVMRGLDYRRFCDPRRSSRLPVVGKGLTLLAGNGFHAGAYLRTWLAELLAGLGVRTFADLRTDTPGRPAPLSERYKLVVLAADVSLGRLVRLPWDYHLYGLDPDEQLVADAVRASASIPFFFEPARLRDSAGYTSLLVDGGILSTFPVDMFDDHHGPSPARPVIGVKLVKGFQPSPTRTIGGPFGMALAMISTVFTFHEDRVLDRVRWQDRTIFVRADDGVGRADFGLDRATQEALYRAGRAGAEEFLASWEPPRPAGQPLPRRVAEATVR
jgi:NTE family protein